MSAVVLRKLDFVKGMRVTAVRHLNDGPELVRFRNVIFGFEVFTPRAKGEKLARTVRSHRLNFYGRVPRHGTRLLARVIEKESEARHIGFEDGDFNKAVTEVDEEALVRAAFDFPTVRRMPAKKMRVAVASTAHVPNRGVEA